MPVDYQGTRRHWYLPLFGGAEMNRIKRPPPPPEKVYLTLVSHLYPVQFMDSVQSTPPVYADTPAAYWLDNAQVSVPSYLPGSLREPLQTYEYGPEPVVITVPVYSNGTLGAPPVGSYTIPWDQTRISVPTYAPGTLRVVRITYASWSALIADEQTLVTAPIYTNGTLT